MKIIFFLVSVTCWGISKGSPLILDSSAFENAKKQQDIEGPLNFLSNDQANKDFQHLEPHAQELIIQQNIKENQKVNPDNKMEDNLIFKRLASENEWEISTSPSMTTWSSPITMTTTTPPPTTTSTMPAPTTTTSTTPKSTTTTSTTPEPTNSDEDKRDNIHINDHHILGPFAGELVNHIRNSKGRQDVNQNNKIVFNFGKK